MGIKFLEIDSTETNEFGVFRNDYIESLEQQMTKKKDGFYYSHALQPILLNQFKRKKKRLVRGYDIGNNNILCKEQKIIEFTQYLDQEKEILYIAFTYMSDDIHICMSQTECNVYLYSIDLKDERFLNALEDKSQNIFDLVDPIQITKHELNRKLSFNETNNTLSWERISNYSSPNERIKTVTYDIYNNKIIDEQDLCPIYEQDIEIKIEEAHLHPKINIHYEKIEGIADFYIAVIEPREKQAKKHPAITICLGGPQIPIPDFYAKNSIYEHFLNNGYYIICPLRREVIGVSYEWEHAIDGKCGTNEVEDIIYATDWVLEKYKDEIDEHKVGLYGASYGGFSSFLIAGKYNNTQRFKAFVSHCGIFNLGTYLNESYGGEMNIISGFIGSEDKEKYLKEIKDFSPHYFVEKWNAPMLIVHAIDDSSAWFGQSVKAYNTALSYDKDVKLLLNPGPHTYNIEGIEIIFNHITDYLKEKLSL